MELTVYWFNRRTVELQADETTTGPINATEAREVAKNLIKCAEELLSVEESE